MHKKYLKLASDVYLANIASVEMFQTAKAILQQHAVERIPRSLNDNGITINDSMWQSFLPFELVCDSAIIPVIDPIKRFCGLVDHWDYRGTIDDLLDTLEDSNNIDFYKNSTFIPVAHFVDDNSVLYRLPEYIDKFKNVLNVTIDPFIDIDISILSAEQLGRVQSIYYEDIVIFESINNSGQSYDESFAVVTEEDKVLKHNEIKAARDDAYQSILTTSFGLQFKADLETIIDIQTIVSLLADGDIYPNYKTANGEYHNISKEQFTLAIAEGVQRKGTAFTREYALSQHIKAANTKTELEAIVW